MYVLYICLTHSVCNRSEHGVFSTPRKDTVHPASRTFCIQAPPTVTIVGLHLAPAVMPAFLRCKATSSSSARNTILVATQFFSFRTSFRPLSPAARPQYRLRFFRVRLLFCRGQDGQNYLGIDVPQLSTLFVQLVHDRCSLLFLRSAVNSDWTSVTSALDRRLLHPNSTERQR